MILVEKEIIFGIELAKLSINTNSKLDKNGGLEKLDRRHHISCHGDFFPLDISNCTKQFNNIQFNIQF